MSHGYRATLGHPINESSGEETPLLQGQSAPQSTPQKEPHKVLKYKFGFVAVVLSIIALSRAAMLGVVTWLPCSNMTNSSDYAEIPDELDSNLRYFRVTNLLYVIYSSLDCPEYLVLTYGVYKLCVESLEGKTSIKKDLKILFQEIKCRIWCGITLATVFIIIFLFTSVAITVVGIWLFFAFIDSECYPDYKEQQVAHTFHFVYQILTILAHLISVAIRTGMILTVLEVRAIWFHTDMDETIPNRTDDVADSTLSKVEKAAVSRYYESVKKYEQRVDKIKPLLQVFQTWFVFQWFQYFFQAITNLTRTLQPWITGMHQPKLITAYHFVFTFFDILAFSIPHVCGLKMNAYHEQYLRDERNNLLKEAQSKLEYVKAYSMKIERSKYGDFVPGIRMTGIKVPLDSTGYTLGIFLTIFALAGSFISFNA